MNIKEYNRIVTAFEKSRNFLGLEAFRLYNQLTIEDWNCIRDEEWYFKSKEQRIRIITIYLRDKQKYGKR